MRLNKRSHKRLSKRHHRNTGVLSSLFMLTFTSLHLHRSRCDAGRAGEAASLTVLRQNLIKERFCWHCEHIQESSRQILDKKPLRIITYDSISLTPVVCV
ncbi:hypothetical protein FHG87_016114 [Trinorchestia longiramus]|nr:hypothetical protein FHG87_016114 [Trinorchestia longiramus]